MYVGHLCKLKGVRDRCVKYNMKDPLKIISMVNETTPDPTVRWGYVTTKRELLVCLSHINLGEVIYFQCDTNVFTAK